MDKYKLAIVPLFVGLGLLCYSWFLSYPLSIDYPTDVVFNHLSYFCWIGFPLILSSLFIICVFSNNHIVKASSCAAIVLTIYSLTFFYSSTPTSDSQYFRGLTEYFINTKSLDASQASHTYFQWPSYFLLGYIVNAVTGLSVINAEFLFYAILGVLLAITLYVYASLNFNKTGFLAVIAFFVSVFYFLNFQWVPFTFAFTLLIILLMLEASEKWQEKYKSSVVPTFVILFLCISLAHLFVALFFVLYLLVRMIISRKKQYVSSFFLCISIYFLIQLTIALTSLEKNVQNIFRLPSEYTALVSYTVSERAIPLDLLAQNLSRIITVSFVLICVIGFVFMFFKRRLRITDIVIFLVGIIYTASGVFLFLLGNRGLPLAFIPVSLGIAYLIRTKLKPYLIPLILTLLILFVSIPIHTTFNTYTFSYVPFQTQEEYSAENFILNYYDWARPSLVLAHFSSISYLESKIDSKNSQVTLQTEFSMPNFPEITSNCILFTIGLENNFVAGNYSVQQALSENGFSVCYNAGNSLIAIRK